MKKKNTILLVVDSVFYDKLLSDKTRNSAMPFFNKLQKKGLTTTKMYSEAPYTEAALVSLLCGMDTLKRGGYLKKLSNKKTIMEVFKDNDYEVFFNGFQPHVYPGKSYPGVTEIYYNVPFDINSLWSYRFKYYSDLFKNNELNDKYFDMLNDILNDNFIEWLKFFNRLKNNDKSVELIKEYIKYDDLDKEIKKLETEYNKYKNNELKYLKEFLNKGIDHNLFKIKTYRLERKTSLEFRKKLYNQYINTFKRINRLNISKNLFNNKLIIKNPFKEKELFIQYLKMYKNAVFDKDLFEKIDFNTQYIKGAPSMYTHINHFCEWLKNKSNEKNYFAYIHVDDCHYPEIFYSYDIDDEKRLEQEFNNINDYLNKLPKKYKGSIAYDLSLKYADSCIEYLYNYLEKNDLLNNVNIAICADHGSSYSFYPMHENYVNNQYQENYHLPFVLIGKDINHKVIKKYCNSKDIPATIIDAANLKVPKIYDGKSLLKYDGNSYAMLENINGGCPDYNKRKVLIGIRNDNYAVTMEFDMNLEFENGEIYSIFDMKKDPFERINLKNNINICNKINKEKLLIEEKFYELKKDIKKHNFLNSGENNEKN